jgi:ribosomal protein L11 methyltransferase
MPKTKISQKYVNLHIKIFEEYYDKAMFYLSDYPFTGVEERMDELVVTFKSEDWKQELAQEIINDLKKISEDAEILQISSITEQNWNEEFEKSVKPIIVNENIGITPEWKKDEINTKIKILINPKMSFGTGDHESTRLISRLAEKVVKPDSKWIDVGTGTGVLAILGIKLGAKEVFAFDNNEWSVENTEENIQLNDVSDKIKIEMLDIDEITLPKADGIFANLFRHLLIQNFTKFYESLKTRNGDLLIAGILKFDFDEVNKQAEEAGFELIEKISENDWVSAHYRAREGH